MSADTVHWAREVYKLLVPTNEGYSVADLARQLTLNERTVREAVSLCRLLGAQNSSPVHGRRIIGFDPGMNAYADAKTAEQSERIMLHLHSRVREMLEQLDAMADAHLERFGQSEAVLAVQGSLFQEKEIKEKMRWP